MRSLFALVLVLMVAVAQSIPNRQGGSILYGQAPKSFNDANSRGQDGRYVYVYDDEYGRAGGAWGAGSSSDNRGNAIYESNTYGGHHLNAKSIGKLHNKKHTTTVAPTTATTDGSTTPDAPSTPGPSPNGGNYFGNTGINFNMGGPSITGPFTANGGGHVKVKVFGPRINGPFAFNKLVTEAITTTEQPMTTTPTAEETTTTKKSYGNFIGGPFVNDVNDGYRGHGGRVYGGYGDGYASSYGTGYDTGYGSDYGTGYGTGYDSGYANYRGNREYSGSRQLYSRGHGGGGGGGGSGALQLKKRFGY